MSQDFFSRDGVPSDKFPLLSHFSISLLGGGYPHSLPCDDAVNDFLTSCRPLKGLSLTKCYKIITLPEILLRHGPSLRKLSLHELGSARHVLSTTELQNIRDACPFLEDVEVDINCSPDGKAEQELFSSLARFPKLAVVRFYIDLGIVRGSSGVRMPLYEANPFCTGNSGWLERIWAIFESEKHWNKSVPLEELHVKIGQWECTMGPGYPAFRLLLDKSNRRYLRARASDRDDFPNEIEIARDDGSDDHSGLKGWETRPFPSSWRFGEKWEVPQAVGKRMKPYPFPI